MTDSTLESLLRELPLKHGRICLYVQDGEWYGAVTHFHGHQTVGFRSNTGAWLKHDWFTDPVEALSSVLIEDKRVSGDLERRYAAAPKRAAVDDDYEDMFG